MERYGAIEDQYMEELMLTPTQDRILCRKPLLPDLEVVTMSAVAVPICHSGSSEP